MAQPEILLRGKQLHQRCRGARDTCPAPHPVWLSDHTSTGSGGNAGKLRNHFAGLVPHHLENAATLSRHSGINLTRNKPASVRIMADSGRLLLAGCTSSQAVSAT
jgi:hypothetical protein